MLGILDPVIKLEVDVAAWGVLQKRDQKEAVWKAYRAREGRRELAYMVGRILAGEEISETPEPDAPPSKAETVQIFVNGERRTVPAPRPGEFYDAAGNLRGRKRSERPAACDPHVFVDGECRGCDLRNDGGVLRYGAAPVECESHMMKDGECINCGGRDMGGWVTRPTPRVLGKCEHARHVPHGGGQFRCLDCGSIGM
jgi:hypothetical protein